MKNRATKSTNVREPSWSQKLGTIIHGGFILPPDKLRPVVTTRHFGIGSIEIDLADIMEDLNYGRD